jgi:hypothetical protein
VDKVRIESAIGEKVVGTEVTETSHRIPQVLETHDGRPIRRNRLCKNPSSISQTLYPVSPRPEYLEEVADAYFEELNEGP